MLGVGDDLLVGERRTISVIAFCSSVFSVYGEGATAMSRALQVLGVGGDIEGYRREKSLADWSAS